MKTPKAVSLTLCALLLAFTVSSLTAQEKKEIVFPDFKPTLTGHKNNAFVRMGKDGPEKAVFWRKDEPKYTLVAALGGGFWGGGFEIGRNGEKILFGECYVAIDSDTQFSGNLDYEDSVYTFIGKVRLLKHTFESDEKDPLVFKLLKNKGFVHVTGRGAVTTPKGDKIVIGATSN